MKKVDLIYKNTGRSLAHRIQQTAFNISRSNAKDSAPGNIPPLLSTEGAALAKRTAPCNAFEVPYLDDRHERFAVSDEEREAWRKFKNGDDPSAIQPDPLSALSAESDEEEEPEAEFGEEEEDTDEDDLLGPEIVKTGNAFDRTRLYRAIDRLSRRSKRRVASRDGRSYGRDGRGYSVCSGFIGGVQEWNEAYRRGEVC